MNNDDNSEGILLRQSEILKDISKSDMDEKYYKTKDMYVAAFLIVNGIDVLGYQEREIQKVVNKAGEKIYRKQRLIFFIFPNKSQCQRYHLQFHNQNRENRNVNANSYVKTWLSIRSIITDPPF